MRERKGEGMRAAPDRPAAAEEDVEEAEAEEEEEGPADADGTADAGLGAPRGAVPFAMSMASGVERAATVSARAVAVAEAEIREGGCTAPPEAGSADADADADAAAADAPLLAEARRPAVAALGPETVALALLLPLVLDTGICPPPGDNKFAEEASADKGVPLPAPPAATVVAARLSLA